MTLFPVIGYPMIKAENRENVKGGIIIQNVHKNRNMDCERKEKNDIDLTRYSKAKWEKTIVTK